MVGTAECGLDVNQPGLVSVVSQLIYLRKPVMTEKIKTRRETAAKTVAWTLASGVMMLAAGRLVSAVLVRWSWPYVLPVPTVLLLLAVLLILGGPAAVLVIGIRKRSLSMIAGPLLLIPIIAAYSIASNWFEMRRLSRDVAALDMRSFAMPSQDHDLIVLEYSRSTDCDDLCRQILQRTDRSVGVPGYGSHPVVYRKISEARCKETWYSAKNIRFGDICATLVARETVDDALLIETPDTIVSGGDMGPEIFSKLPPIEFSGQAFALVERIPGTPDRILGRWVAGEVSVWPFHSGPIGMGFDRKKFYAAALGFSFD
jgi:hypothetical protein